MGISLQNTNKKPLQWLILTVLIFIFVGIMIGGLHEKDEKSLLLNTSQITIYKDASDLLQNVQKETMQRVNYREAYLSFTNSQYELCYRQMLPYALSANINATLIMGFMSEYGLGMPVNLKKAALWYYIGVRQSVYNKQTILHGLHAYNVQDYKTAAKWFLLSSELNSDRF